MRRLSCTALFAIMLMACGSQPLSAQVPAFPGAEGAGAMSLGGRGGRVIHVTNLQDSGPGSLRAAIESSGPRTIVFDIGGTIRLKTPLVIRYGRVTVAGQTAPGGGITLRDQSFSVHADDVVVRFIRSRMGDVSRAVGDSIWVSQGNRIILDHVSTSWSTDETLSVTQGYKRPGRLLGDVTVQWSIIAESLCQSANPKGRHCFGSIIGGSRGARITFHHNLWALHAQRMPRLGNSLPPEQDPEGAFIDLRYNVMYDWEGHQAGYGGIPPGVVAFNLIGNSYRTGPDSHGDWIFKEGNPAAHAFIAANSFNGEIQRSPLDHVTGDIRPDYLLPAPVPMPPITADDAASAYGKVLALAGASLVRDPVDARVLAKVRNRTGGLINSQDEVGGWPQLAPGRPWVDSDGDGIPDDRERAHGLNPRDPRDGSRVGSDGYTNLEHWLNELAAPAMPR
jgi:hypothetical protein